MDINIIQLYLIPSNKIPWNDVYCLISEACKYNNNRYSAEDVRGFLVSGEQQLWLAVEDEILGLAITEIVNYPRKKCCMIDICTGKRMEEWLHYLSEIERWAEAQGCQQMLCAARIGFGRILKDYKKTHYIVEKELGTRT